MPKLGRSEKLDHNGPSFHIRDFCLSWAEVEMWTKLVHIFHSRNFGPSWSEAGNPRHDGTNYLAESKAKMCAKLALLFYESTLLEMWDNLSHISKGETNNRNSGQVVLNYLTYADQLPADLAGSSEQLGVNFVPTWHEVRGRRLSANLARSCGKEVRPGDDRIAPLRREGDKEKGKEVHQMKIRHSSSTHVGWTQEARTGP